MIDSFRNIFAIPDLRKRLAFTFGLLAVYRVGCNIPTPGIDPAALLEFMEAVQGTLLGMVNTFTGGSLSRVAIFALGIMPYITVANVACGFHGSDPNHMRTTVGLAKRNDVKVGAHPSYPDLQGFGRREMKIPREELANILIYQVGALKGFLEALDARGLTERTVILLTSDHGEELLDHGQVGHGGTLFREVIDIPLLIRFPGQSRTGAVSDAARLLDVFPTLLSAAGIEAPPGLEGRDLLAEPPDTPEIVAETRHGRRYRVSLRRGDWKYIRTYRAPRTAVKVDR